MAKGRWTDWVDPLGLLGGEAGRVFEDIAKLPVAAAQKAFETTVRSVAMALEGGTVSSSVDGESSATLSRVVEVVPALTLPVVIGGRMPLWQRLTVELAAGIWQGRDFQRAVVSARDVGLDPRRMDRVEVGRLVADVEMSTEGVRSWIAEMGLPGRVEIVDGSFEVRPRRFSRWTSSTVEPEIHNQRVYLHVRSAGFLGRTTSRVAGLPVALSFPVPDAPTDFSVTQVTVEGETVRARVGATDMMVPVDLGAALAAAGAEGAQVASALVAILGSVRP